MGSDLSSDDDGSTVVSATFRPISRDVIDKNMEVRRMAGAMALTVEDYDKIIQDYLTEQEQEDYEYFLNNPQLPLHKEYEPSLWFNIYVTIIIGMIVVTVVIALCKLAQPIVMSMLDCIWFLGERVWDIFFPPPPIRRRDLMRDQSPEFVYIEEQERRPPRPTSGRCVVQADVHHDASPTDEVQPPMFELMPARGPPEVDPPEVDPPAVDPPAVDPPEPGPSTPYTRSKAAQGQGSRDDSPAFNTRSSSQMVQRSKSFGTSPGKTPSVSRSGSLRAVAGGKSPNVKGSASPSKMQLGETAKSK